MKKSSYKLCWECNKRFHGNYKYESQTPDGRTVYVHKQCIKKARTWDLEDDEVATVIEEAHKEVNSWPEWLKENSATIHPKRV